MIVGQWREGFPRVTLTLLGGREPLTLDFIVDTGFDGDIALPERLITLLGISATGAQFVELAGGFRQRCFSFEVMIEWEEQERVAEVLTLDGNPLLGNGLWRNQVLHAENIDSGEILFEPL